MQFQCINILSVLFPVLLLFHSVSVNSLKDLKIIWVSLKYSGGSLIILWAGSVDEPWYCAEEIKDFVLEVAQVRGNLDKWGEGDEEIMEWIL